MVSSFNFFSYPTRDSLHPELFGDFDGSSAKELINALVNYGTDFFQIFIDTDNLKTIHPFGRKVFLKSFSAISKQAGNIIFIGKHRRNIDPQRNNFDVYFWDFTITLIFILKSQSNRRINHRFNIINFYWNSRHTLFVWCCRLPAGSLLW